MPLETPILTAVPAVLNFLVKGAQTGFELQQVPEETKALFQTIASTRSDIVKAREKRVALTKVCDADDLSEWDRSVRETEAALDHLEKLVEHVRLDVQQKKGSVQAKTRLMWVIRDSKSLSATSDRLTLAHQRMLYVMLMTQMRYEQGPCIRPIQGTQEAPPPYAVKQDATKKAVAERRKEDKERIAALGSVGGLQGDRLPNTAEVEEMNVLVSEDDQRTLVDGKTVNKRQSSVKPAATSPLTHESFKFPQNTPSTGQIRRRRTTTFPPSTTQPHVSSVSLPDITEMTPMTAPATHDIRRSEVELQSAFMTPLASRLELRSRISEMPELDSTQVAPSAESNSREEIPSLRTYPASTHVAPKRVGRTNTKFATAVKVVNPYKEHEISSSTAVVSERHFGHGAPSKPAQVYPNPPYPLSPRISSRTAHPTTPGVKSLPLSYETQQKEATEGQPKHFRKPHDHSVRSPSPDSKSNGVINIQKSFAGHRRPISVRWEPLPEESSTSGAMTPNSQPPDLLTFEEQQPQVGPDSDMGGPSDQHVVQLNQTYLPYRPNMN